MRRNLAGIVVVLILLSLVGVSNAKGSYASFDTDEIIQQSDIILIGEIIGPVNERKDWSQGLKGTWSTYWKVQVYYYLKGNETAQEFIVATPGAENKLVMTSIDYRLDQWGNTVLLFLKQRKNGFEPFSPQGVVALEKQGINQNSAEGVAGQQILKEFTIVDPQINELHVLEKYILDNNSILIPIPSTAGTKLSSYKRIIGITIGLGAVLTGIWLVKRRLKKR